MDPRLRLFGSFALLGTDRRRPSFPENEFPAGSLIRELADAGETSPDSCAETLLRGAGILSICGLAGWQPASDDGITMDPPRCPEESRPMLQEGLPVTALYGDIFRSGLLRLQWEALSYLDKRGSVMPHSLLVPALMMGRGAPALRTLLSRTVGVRGLWLASLNPDWRMFASSSGSEPEMEAWEHGRPMQRQAFFLAVRTADPAGARKLFEKDMGSMDASERGTLLGLFLHGLSDYDEDLLERLMFGDRSREVKKTAASLLSRLPGSRYVTRMGERLSACMGKPSGGSAPSALSGFFRAAASVMGLADRKDFIAPPESYDTSWTGDLIAEKSPSSQFGPRAGWLYQMAVAVPLSWWTVHSGRTPAELLELAECSEWKKPLLTAWGDAQLRCRDADWARAMLKRMKKGGVWPTSAGDRLDSFYLAGLLKREERELFWENMLSQDTLPDLLQDIRARQELEYRMSPALADKALQALKSRLSSTERRDYMLSSVIEELAMILPEESLDKARQTVADLPADSLNRELSDRFSAVVLQRRTLHSCFS